MEERKQQNLEVILLILVIALAGIAYYFGYMRYISEAKNAQSERLQVESKIAEINEKKQLQNEFAISFSEDKQEVQDIASKYGTGNSAEKDIMFVRTLEKLSGSEITSVSFTDDQPVYVSSRIDAATKEPEITAYTSTLVINYEMTYQKLRETLDFIHSYPERMNVDNITVSVNSETDKLTGSMTINLYAVTGGDREYVAPEISGVKIGTDDLFGTGNGKKK